MRYDGAVEDSFPALAGPPTATARHPATSSQYPFLEFRQEKFGTMDVLARSGGIQVCVEAS
jgi:hypothetical protein